LTSPAAARTLPWRHAGARAYVDPALRLWRTNPATTSLPPART